MENRIKVAGVNWAELQVLAVRLSQPDEKPGNTLDSEWLLIEEALTALQVTEDWQGLVKIRLLFDDLFARDSVAGVGLIQEIDDAAIQAARQLEDTEKLAHFLGAKGHNLHRQGYHKQSIEAFSESAMLYRQIGEEWEATKNRYMTALCFRALGNREAAYQVLNKVLQEVDADHPWYGQPLQVKAWLVQDTGNLEEAEELLRQAIQLHRKGEDSDILVAGALADLAEVVGLQNRVTEAQGLFNQSLVILKKYGGQYNRQVGRSKLKLAELLMREQDYERCLILLDEADDLIRGYGHYYDLMWRIELLRSLVHLRLCRPKMALLKFRATMRYRKELGLPNLMLVRQFLFRMRAGIGFPR